MDTPTIGYGAMTLCCPDLGGGVVTCADGELGVAESKFGERINTIVNFTPVVGVGPDGYQVHLRAADCDGRMVCVVFSENDWYAMTEYVKKQLVRQSASRLNATVP